MNRRHKGYMEVLKLMVVLMFALAVLYIAGCTTLDADEYEYRRVEYYHTTF